MTRPVHLDRPDLNYCAPFCGMPEAEWLREVSTNHYNLATCSPCRKAARVAYPDWNDGGRGTSAHGSAIGPYSVDGEPYKDGRRLVWESSK